MKMKEKKHRIKYQPRNNSLKCTCCGKYYNQLFAMAQAVHCASHFWYNENTWYIYGSYPSGFDDTKFIINNEPDIIQSRHIIAFAQREANKDTYGHYDNSKLVVCDACISQFLFQQWIVEDISYNPYAAIEELNSFYAEDPVLYMDIMMSGPSKCIALIREERSKPMEQRLKEREERALKKLQSGI